MKKFINPITISAFLIGAILFSGITTYANNLRNGVIVNTEDIGFYQDDNYHSGIYIDPNTGNFVFSSRYGRDVELNSEGDILLNAESNVYVGTIRSKDNKVVTNSQLMAEIQKLQIQINALKKR